MVIKFNFTKSLNVKSNNHKRIHEKNENEDIWESNNIR